MYRSSKNNASIFLQSNYKGEIHNSPHKQTLIDIAMKPPCFLEVQHKKKGSITWNETKISIWRRKKLLDGRFLDKVDFTDYRSASLKFWPLQLYSLVPFASKYIFFFFFLIGNASKYIFLLCFLLMLTINKLSTQNCLNWVCLWKIKVLSKKSKMS